MNSLVVRKGRPVHILSMPVSREEIIWAYRLILGREPESDAVITAAMATRDVTELRRNFLFSDEFRMSATQRPLNSQPVDREAQARTYIRKDDLGIEVGAWFNPLVPRSDGYNSISLDVFDTAELKRRAKADVDISPQQAARIQDVDLVGSVTQIEQLVSERGLLGNIDYIISAHNFEHIPDAITFFQSCQKVLRPEGFLSMIIPDHRNCFDYFRPRTTTGNLLDAFYARRNTPSPGQIFDHFAMYSENFIDGARRSGWSQGDSTDNVVMTNDIGSAFEKIDPDTVGDMPYVDAHCWILTPASFRSIFCDLQSTKLVNLTLVEVTAFGSHEFFVHIKNSPPDEASRLNASSTINRTILSRAARNGE